MMNGDINQNAKVMAATAQVLAVLAPFTVQERIEIIAGSVIFSGISEAIMGRASPEVQELLKKVKPK